MKKWMIGLAAWLLIGVSLGGAEDSAGGDQGSKRSFPYGKKLRLRREGYGSLTDGKGLVLFGAHENKGNPKGHAASAPTVNTFLWTAALDTITFMPLASSDAPGGVLITDWYIDPQTPHKRFKVTVRIQGIEFHPHNLTVQVHTQHKSKDGTWGVMVNDTQVAQELEKVIVDHAKILYAQAHPETHLKQ